MDNKDFSQFYGKPAKIWANTQEGREFAKYLEAMVAGKKYLELSSQEQACYEDYMKFEYTEKFKVLYDKPAPWKDEELGNDFRNYLESADLNNKQLTDAEKRCLEDLKKWKKEHPEESENLENGNAYDLDNMNWQAIRKVGDVYYFLNGLTAPSKEDKNIVNYVNSEWMRGKSPSSIANYAEDMYQKQLGMYTLEKTQEMEQDANLTKTGKIIAKTMRSLGKISKQEPSIGLKDRIMVVVAFNKANKQQTTNQNDDSALSDENAKTRVNNQEEISNSVEDERQM